MAEATNTRTSSRTVRAKPKIRSLPISSLPRARVKSRPDPPAARTASPNTTSFFGSKKNSGDSARISGNQGAELSRINLGGEEFLAGLATARVLQSNGLIGTAKAVPFHKQEM